jgi:hypothetical protein
MGCIGSRWPFGRVLHSGSLGCDVSGANPYQDMGCEPQGKLHPRDGGSKQPTLVVWSDLSEGWIDMPVTPQAVPASMLGSMGWQASVSFASSSAAPAVVAGHRLYTSAMVARWPTEATRRASHVTRVAFSVSARATYTASYAVRLCRKAQMRARKRSCG